MSSSLNSELAGLATAVLWAGSAMCWAVLGRRVNPTTVASVRLVFAAALLAAGHALYFGRAWPVGVPARAFWVLCLSGVMGAALGDALYFHSMALIGPRLSMTIVCLAPVAAAAIVMLPPLREHMTVRQVAGMLLAIAGVIWVVAEKRGREAWPVSPGLFRRGVILGVIGMLFAAVGYVLSRAGMNRFTPEPVPALSAALIRIAAAGVWLAGMTLLNRRARAGVRAFRDVGNLKWMLAGVTAGPVIGIWLSMVALQGAATGVASTLISLSPLALIPLSWAAYGERPTWGRVLATVVALGGVGLIMAG